MYNEFDLIDQILLWRDEDWSPTCDPSDEELIFGSRRSARDEYSFLVDRYLSGLMAATHPVVGTAIRESRQRSFGLAELLAMNPRQQRRAVRRPPYRDLVVANCLLDESRKLAPKNPAKAERCALLAEWIADQPWPDEPEKAATVLLNALFMQGDVFRLHRDWKKAELRFAAAYGLLRGRAAHNAHSTFCRKLSQLRADQGRYEEAALLDLQSMRIYCMIWDRERLSSEGLCRLAILALKQNNPGRAMAILTQLCLDQESDPFFGWVGKEADAVRAICMAAIGDADTARGLIAEVLSTSRCIQDRRDALSYEWLECRIATHLGDLDRAIPRLEAIRRWLMTGDGELDEICLVSIDLALAHAKKGQSAERLPGLLADIAQRPGAAEKPWALGSLWRFREALDRGQDPAAAAREAAEIVHRREMSLKRLAARRYPARA